MNNNYNINTSGYEFLEALSEKFDKELMISL